MLDHTHLHVEFFSNPVENKAKSAQEGRPIFEDAEFVRIKFRGDKNRILVAPAQDTHVRDRDTNRWLTYAESYPKHYDAFKQGQEFIGDGTPISELPFLTEAKRSELRALNIHTAEALQGLEGTPLQKLNMGGRALKDQATAWLTKASDGALESRLAGENAALKEQMALMQAQIAELVGGKKTAPVAASTSPFADMTVADLKAFLEDRNGTKPRGNPSKATLVAMCEAVIEREKAEAE
jgi:hypothetical protein